MFSEQVFLIFISQSLIHVSVGLLECRHGSLDKNCVHIIGFFGKIPPTTQFFERHNKMYVSRSCSMIRIIIIFA